MSRPDQTPAHAAMRHFPLNAWYAAAWDHEVGRNLMAKTVAGRPIVFYRTTGGRPVALADACWHRLAPLSMGKLRGDDEIMCGYHGICYDADGRATFMPAQDTINPSATVHSYPVVERHRYVWVWPGDPALADPASVPDLYWNDHPDWAGDGKTIHVNCSYQLIVDAAARLATIEGLEGLSIGRLADEIGMSKSGLYAHFDSKQDLQLAAVDAAEAVYTSEVVAPAMQAPEGVKRLELLCERYLSYVKRGVFPGGCFFAATTVKRALGYDDSLDVFGVHCIGGIIGAILTGVFAVEAIGGAKGALEGNVGQIFTQIEGVAATLIWSGLATFVILIVVNIITGVRVGQAVEVEGLDINLHGEVVP